MAKYETREQFRAAVVRQGGLFYLIFDYGVDPEDMPDQETAAVVAEILKAVPALYRLEQMLWGEEL